MKLYKINLKLIETKTILFLLIFTLGVGILLYQMYINSIQTSIIEGLSLEGSNNDSMQSNIMDLISKLFEKKCLTGCVRPESLSKDKCEKIKDKNGKYVYECPWKCDNTKFNEFLKNNPDLSNQLSSYRRCSPESESRDCGSCMPNRVFSI